MEVRARPALAPLPFVLYTSTYNSPGDRELAESVGADAYLTKPAPTVRLIEALTSAQARRPVPPVVPCC
jgi:CheY-like chemotaxis protein